MEIGYIIAVISGVVLVLYTIYVFAYVVPKEWGKDYFHDIYIKFKRWFQLNYCSDIPRPFLKRKDIHFQHCHGISIGGFSEIGHGVTIYQNVTIGGKYENNADSYPVICDGVTIFAHSVIIGKIKVGKDSVIGAYSFVNKDIPKNEVWAGIPAKFIRKVCE